MNIKKLLSRRCACEQLEQRAMLTTFVVDTLSDTVDAQDNRTSLREAVLAANENPGEDEIVFADRVTGRLLLQNGELAVSDSVRIVGPGAHLLTIDALGNDPTPQDANGDGSPAFAVGREIREPFSRFHLSDVTLTGADGGALSVSLGSLSRVVVEGNSGGAVGIARPITSVADGEDEWFRITDSVFRNNSPGTAFGVNGGAISAGAKLHIERSLFEGNQAGDAGAIRVSNSTRIEESRFINNFAKGDGGAIYGTLASNSGATFEVYNSTFANNVVDDVGVDAPDGSAMALRGFAEVNIVGSTISGNETRTHAGSFTGDGAIDYRGGGSVTIDRTTIVNNIHTGPNADWASYGGVVQWDGPLRVVNSVIANNSGEQLRLSSVNDIRHSFIGSSFDDRLPPTNGRPDSLGNIVGGPNELLDPMLEELADNGSGVLTHMPAEGSPLIDAGDPAFNAEMARMGFDQRGEPFARIVDGRIDIGSIEYSRPLENPFTFFNHDVACCTVDGPTTLDSGDIDGDGDTDVVVGLLEEGSIAWFDSGSDSLGFGARTDVATSVEDVRDVRLFDLDGDGDLDVVYASYGDRPVGWVENLDGRGHFGVARLISDGGASRVAAADIDLDGDLDIATISKLTGALEWHRNDSNARSFRGPFTVTDNLQNPDSLELADLNRDGTPDFLVGGTTSHVLLWYENHRRGTATREHTVSALITDSYDSVPVDMDGDGDLDVVTSIVVEDQGQYDNDMIWMENTDGRGALTVGHNIGVALSGTEWMEPIDVDGDGDMDVVVALSLDRELVWFENLGNSTAFARRSIATRLPDVFDGTVADFDRDGDIEIVVASYSDDRITLYEATADVRSSWIATPVDPPAVSIAHTGDIDGDGKVDIVAADSQSGEVYWFRNLGDEQFGPARFAGDGRLRTSMIRTADLDANGHEDLITATETTIVWFQSQGNGGFTDRRSLGLGLKGISSFEIVDVDADGDVDVVVTSEDELVWLENVNWTVRSSRPQAIPESQDPHWSAVAHIDSDNGIDVVAGLNDSLVWYRNQDSDERFSTAQIIDNHKVYTHGAVADVDGDGDSDIVVAEPHGQAERLFWYRNTNGGFDERIEIDNLISSVDEISLADFDSDGDADLLIRRSDARQVTWIEGLGGGTFGRSFEIAPYGDADVHIADLDQDGNLDLLFTDGGTDHVHWLEQRIPGDSNNDGLFDSSDLVAVFTAAEYEDDIPNNSTFAEGDWNLDGDFNTSDLVHAFRSGRYGNGPRPVAAKVAAAIDVVFEDDIDGDTAQVKTGQANWSLANPKRARDCFLP